MPAPWLDPDALLRAGRNRAVQALIGAGFLIYLLYHLTRFRVADVWPIVPRGDAVIVFDAAVGIFSRSAYPDGIFPYSPSAVVMFRALSLAGPTVFMVAWYVLMVGGLIVAVRAALTQERSEVRAAWPLIGAMAVALADSPIRWDLRNLNSNLIYLGLVMAGYALARRQPLIAGTLTAMSLSLKLYSGLLIAWLFVNGPRRMLYAAVAATAVLWVVIPIAMFGVDGTIALYSGWLRQVQRIADPSYHAELVAQGSYAPIITLHRAIVNLTGQTFQSPLSIALLWLLRGIWIALLLWYVWRCRNNLAALLPSRAALADWTVLMLAPLPFSPWLEPYHTIPLLIGLVLCIAIAVDRSAEHRDRWAALAAIATPLLFLVVIRVPFSVRGLAVFAQFAVMAAILGLLRPRLARAPTEPG